MTETRYSARWLKQLRERLGMSQQEIADQVGCARNSWSRWETGAAHPLPVYRSALDKLAKRVSRT